MSPLDPAVWRGRRILLTGHTGFKGAWAALWLKQAGAEVTGLSLAAESPALFDIAGVGRDLDHQVIDLRDRDAVAACVARTDPEIVLHLAGQAIVRRAVREPVETVASNVMGTTHLLDALRTAPRLKAALMVTTDKVYDNDGQGRAFSEDDRLGGTDPYGASKAACEIVTRAFAHTYFAPRGVAVATGRAGNVIGGGDFAEDRIIPDIIRASAAGRAVLVRHPDATRPWQHVLDCLSGYFLHLSAMWRGDEAPRALNLGPQSASVTVRTIAEATLAALGDATPWMQDIAAGPAEAHWLQIDSSLARAALGWRERLAAAEAVAWTADWYSAQARGDDMRAVTLAQIDAFEALYGRRA